MANTAVAHALAGIALVVLPLTARAETRSVAECVAIALREHPSLTTADATVWKARAGVNASIAPALPRVDASYAATRAKRNLSQLIQGPSTGVFAVEETFTYQQGQFALNQLLFDFGRTLLARRAALQDLAQATADRDAVAQTVTLNVKETYFDLLVARRLLEVAESTRKNAELHLQTATSRFRAGLAPRFDIVRQELQVANAELEVRSATGNVALARENLRDAMGLAEPITFEPDDAALVPVGVPIDDAQAEALATAQRPELRSFVARRNAQVARIEGLERSYLPVAAGRADYLFSGDDRIDQDGWSIGALIKLPIFDGGMTPARLSEARAELMAIEGEERQTRQTIVLQVRENLVQLRRAAGSIAVANKAVEVGREALRIAENRYGNGLSGILELASTELSYLVSQAQQVRVLADAQQAMARLERAVGGSIGPVPPPAEAYTLPVPEEDAAGTLPPPDPYDAAAPRR